MQVNDLGKRFFLDVDAAGARVSPAMRRLLLHIRGTPRNGRSYNGYPQDVYIVLAGKAVEAGLLRVVKHRDHTRDHRLTPAGVDAIAAEAAPHEPYGLGYMQGRGAA